MDHDPNSGASTLSIGNELFHLKRNISSDEESRLSSAARSDLPSQEHNYSDDMNEPKRRRIDGDLDEVDGQNNREQDTINGNPFASRPTSRNHMPSTSHAHMDDHDEDGETLTHDSRRAVKRVNYAELEDQYTDEEEEEDEEDEDDEELEEQHQTRGSLRNNVQEPLSEDEDEATKQEPPHFGRTLRDRRSIAAPKPFPISNPVSTRKQPNARNSRTPRRYEDDHNMYRSAARSMQPKRPPPVPRPISENMRITRGMRVSLVPDSPSSRNSRDLTPDRPTRRSGRLGSSFSNQMYYDEEHGHESLQHGPGDEDEDVDERIHKGRQDPARNVTPQGDDTGLIRMTRLRARVQAQPQTSSRHTPPPRPSRTQPSQSSRAQQEADRKYDLRERPKNRPTYVADRPIASPSRPRTSRLNIFKRRSGESRSSSSRILPMNIGELAESRRDVIAMRGGQPADTDPLAVGNTVDFDKVGGLDHHIKSLKEMVILPLLYPEVYSHFQMMPPRGVLFHGPPGTGKTLLARALASSCSTETQKVAFFMRKGADCLSKWVGEAERQLRLLFEEAKAWQPSIIFFDEIDGLCPVRSSKQEQIHASIVSTMLALMDGLDGRGQVIVIGATNRIDAIDPALRRPGRFDREFYFPLPNEVARRAIIDINTCGWQPPLDEKFKDELARLTTRYCGADIRALCTEAALKAIRRRYPQIYESNEKLLIDASSIVVEEVDMLKSAKSLTPASYRVTGATASPLPENVKPLLQDQLDMICRAVETVFTGTSKRNAKGKDGEDEDAAFQAMGYRSFEKLKTFRPRMIITGSRGMGQRYVGPALLHYLEGCTVQQFDLAALMSESSRTPEAACVQYFIEVKRHAPSVIYIPHIDVWWTVVSDAVKATFSNLLEDLNPEDGILFLATSETPLSGLPIAIRRWFLSSAKGRIELSKPEAKHRSKFFEPVLQDLLRPPSDFKVKTTGPKVLEPLPKAPPPQPRVPTSEEKKLLKEHDMYILRELRISLRSIVDELFKERKFKPFFRPVEPEESVDYYEIVKKPMDLTTITDKINGHRYLEVKEFLADIDQIVENASLYNGAQDPNRIVYRAQGFQDWVHSMVGRLDPELLVETEKTAAARVRQELKVQKKVQGERMSRRQLGLEAPAVPDNPEIFLRNRFALAKLGVDSSREVSMDPAVKIEVSATIRADGKDGSAASSSEVVVEFGQDDETETLTSVTTESSMAVSEAASEPLDGNMDVDMPKQVEHQESVAAETGSTDVVMQMEGEAGDIHTSIPTSPIVRDVSPSKTESAALANGGHASEKQAEDDRSTLPLSEDLESTRDQDRSQPDDAKEYVTMPMEEATLVADSSVPVEENQEEENEMEETRELELDQDTFTRLGVALVLETDGSTVEELDQLRAALYADIWEHRQDWNKDALLMDMKQTLTSVTSLHRDYRNSEAQAVASFVEAFQ
ncbi:ATPase AAA domain-containing protein 2B [Podila verticillata]|nr:ATPase AAA domain-containing protein 2B [Podila verticillata]